MKKDYRIKIYGLIILLTLLTIICMINMKNIEKLTYESTKDLTYYNKSTIDDINKSVSNTYITNVIGVIFIISLFIYIQIENDIKNRKLYNIAYIDKVTSIGNKTFFIEKGLEKIKEDGSKYVMFLDIDNFKAINKRYTHKVGDEILKGISNKLITILGKNQIITRLSDDFFACFITYNENIEELARRISEELSNINVDNKNIKIKTSLGVYELKKTDKDILLTLDKAIYAHDIIKGNYLKRYYIYDDKLENITLQESSVQAEMEGALKNEEFKIYYQPKVSSKNEKMVGAEALVRWEKNGNTVPPDSFVPIFEKNMFIIKLDLYVFEKVCQDIVEWKNKYKYMPVISINVSKEHFFNENFIDDYCDIANKYGIDITKIDLEITESATVDKNIDIIKILNKIKQKGFMISLDDFGTGYSCLNIIQDMPIDIIKIDKSFIRKADLTRKKPNLIEDILFIAKHIGVKTIAEGAETKEQVEFLNMLGCDMIQGYYYSAPINKSNFEKYFCQNKQ